MARRIGKVSQKTLANEKRIYYDKSSSVRLADKWKTTWERAETVNADRLGAMFCGTRAVFDSMGDYTWQETI